MKRILYLLLPLIACLASAAERTSSAYTIAAEAMDGGGYPAVSAIYSSVGSVGLVAGISTIVSPPGTANAGYIAQLYEVGGFVVSASSSTVEEGGMRQLEALRLLDDATYLAFDPTLVTWSVLSGPIVSISASGLATAGLVYQNSAATVRGTYQGTSSPFNLTVLNVNADDFGSYAGDGIGDDWQVQYFGLPPNASAGPLLDPDGDGQDNLFEFVAGLVPTDADSVFKLRIERSVQGAHLVFSPIVGGRTYIVLFSPSLLAPPRWPELPPGLPTTDVGVERTIIDPDANAVPQRFYHIEITR